MASNYPLPSKASLVQQFVGKSLKEIPLPAAVIDIAAVKRNCQRMSDAVKELGFDFMLLVNAHKVRIYFIIQAASSSRYQSRAFRARNRLQIHSNFTGSGVKQTLRPPGDLTSLILVMHPLGGIFEGKTRLLKVY